MSLCVQAALCGLALMGASGMAGAQTVAAPSSTLGAITVTGSQAASNDTPDTYAGGLVARGGQAGILGNIDMMDMPFTQTSYTAKLIQDQQARTLADVLKNDASVQSGNGYGNQAETFVVRGFPLNNDDLSFNGLYGVLPRQVLPTEMVERVEVFKGASAFLNGATPGSSGLGGVINIQPKRAGDDPLTRLNLDYGARSQLGAGVDIGRRWGEDNEFGVRVNAAHREGETELSDADSRTTVATIGLDYRGEKLRVSLDAGYQKVHFDHVRPPIMVTGAVPDAPSNNINYGQSWTFSDLESTFGVTRVEYDLNDRWTTYAAIGASRDDEHGAYYMPTVGPDGKGSSTPLLVPNIRDTITGEVGLRGEFRTGSIGHRVNLAYSALNTTSKTAYAMGFATGSDIYTENPVALPDTPTWAGGNMDDPNVFSRTKLRSVALSDTLSLFDDNVLLTLGARHQQLVDIAYDYNPALPSTTYKKSITTPAVGLVLRPWDTISVYANYIEGLSKGGSAPLTAVNNGETFAPFRTKQYEAGVKADFGDYGGSIGVFQIEKPEAYLDTTTMVYGPSGKQRNRGLELNAFGEPVKGWRVLGGVTLMDPKLRNTEDPANDGHTAPGVPRFQGVFSTEWDVPALHGLTLQASLLHHGSQYTSASNEYKIPSWTRVDLGAVYRTKLQGRNVTLRAGVDNVANRRYWASVAPQYGQITQGRGRLAKLSMSVDF